MNYGGIRRGRQRSGSGSSSGSESSQGRPTPKRIASPVASDDDDSGLQPVENDDTPPPPSRPLIRQAMAFAANQPPETINTYVAEIPPTVSKPIFLPGQKVPKLKKPAKSKRPDPYPGHTNKFRLGSSYDSTPVAHAQPPILGGDGPYSSQFRGVVPLPQNNASRDSPAVSVSSNGATASSLRDVFIASQASSNSASPAPKKAPAKRKPRAPAKDKKKTTQANNEQQAAAPHRQVTDYPHSSGPSNQSYQATNPNQSYSDSSTAVSVYYRHDYNSDRVRGRSVSPPGQIQPRSSRNYSPTSNTNNRYRHQASENRAERRPTRPLRMITILIHDTRSGTIDHQLVEVKLPLRQSDDPLDGFWADAKDISQQLQNGPWRIDGPARVYTLRGKYRQIIMRVNAMNQDEFLTANVVIQPDRTVDLVVEKLPVPGATPPPPMVPSELYNTAYEDSTLAESERMDVDMQREVHENPRQSRMDVDPHREPREIRRQSHMDLDSRQDSRQDSSNDHRASHEQPVRDARKRANSPSFDDYDTPGSTTLQHPVLNKVPRQDYDWQQSSKQSPRHTSPHRSRPNSGRDLTPSRFSYAPERPASPHHVRSLSPIHSPRPVSPRTSRPVSPPRPPRPMSPRPRPRPISPPRPPRSPSPREEPLHVPRGDQSDGEDIPEMLEDPFIAALDSLLQKDKAWSAYFRAKGRNRVGDVVTQYKFITQNAFLGQFVPGFDRPVEEHHILQAMKIEDKDFLNNYKETLRLLNFYGEGGSHENRRVVEMLKDPSSVKPGGNPYKRLIHLLREVDESEKGKQPYHPPQHPLHPGSHSGAHFRIDNHMDQGT